MAGSISLFESYIDSVANIETVFGKPKVSPIVRCRAARDTDLPLLEELLERNTESIFGSRDVHMIYELSYISMVAENLNREIVAAMFLNNFPNLPSIPPWDWPFWIRTKYNLKDPNPTNTLFVHLSLYKSRYSKYFFTPILRQVLKKCHLVKYVIVIVPTYKKLMDYLPEKMSVIHPQGVYISQPQRLVLYLRHNFLPNYKIRKAVVEDNDDLVNLIDTHSKRLKELYGSYYIAEMVTDLKSRRIIVAEQEGLALAVMIFNEKINLELLSNYFHLECFYGLRKYVKEDDENVLEEQGLLNEEHKVTFNIPQNKDYYTHPYQSPNYQDLYQQSEITHSNPITSSENVSIFSEDIDILFSLASFKEMEEINQNSFILPGENFKGVVEGKFSCNLLHFNETQLRHWQEIPKRDVKTINEQIVKTIEKSHNYKGTVNAFTLELVAAWPEHEKSLNKLLRVGFELFPNRDYCVLCTPSTAPFFQLQTKTFIRVTPLITSNFPHELYVVHRNSIYCSVTMRRAKLSDLDEVKNLLNTMRTGESILYTFLKYLNSQSDDRQSYVVLCDREIVGVVTVKDVTNLAYILGRYQLSRMTDLSMHKPGCCGRIKHFALSPIFQRHVRFLLIELHRLTDYSLLLHYVIPEESPRPYHYNPLPCIINELIPVLPAKVPEFSSLDEKKLGWEVPQSMKAVERPYAVYLSTPRHCGLSRFAINTKIVVVGASEVGLSFLIDLIFNHNPKVHTIFNNVTLVSTHGIPSYKSNRFRAKMLPISSEMTTGYYLSLTSLITYVNVIEGVMSAIDRKAKTITVNSTLVPYDMLFLTCGTQFQPVSRPEKNLHGNKKEFNVTECPENVFVVNTLSDVQWATARMSIFAADKRYNGSYIVYGNCLEAYCCLEALLEVEIPPNDIIFVVPPYDEESGTLPPFPDINVEQAIQNQIQSCGVKILKDYTFCDWKFDESNYRVKTIMFETLTRTYNVPVKAAFMYQKKSVSKITFTAINRANLIFDGGLVINPNFQTNDPNIFAAGRITKYPRRYYADHMKHTYFNQSEIGNRMARMVLGKLLPKIRQDQEEDLLFGKCTEIEGKMLVPWYTKPVVIFAYIPRKIQYLYVRKPGICIPIDVAQLDDKFGEVLTTGDFNNLDDKGYFLLHLNQYNTIETIIALSKNAIEWNNLTVSWGKHETLFKNLTVRYKMGLIKDFFAFFAKPWLHTLFHDKYEVLEKNITKLLTQKSIEPGLSIMEDIVSKIEENNMNTLTSSHYTEIIAKFEHSEYRKEIRRIALEFLTENHAYLPMYATPGEVTMLLGAHNESPLFTKL